MVVEHDGQNRNLTAARARKVPVVIVPGQIDRTSGSAQKVSEATGSPA